MAPAALPPQGVAVSVEAPSGCRVQSQLVREQGRIDFRNLTCHVRGPSKCQCRRNPDPMQEKYNEESLSRHAHNLWDSGKCGPTEMLRIFAHLKLGLPVEERFELCWDEEKKVWL
ncbi:hypothetical protein F5Y19DRAFT_408066 [Xylariaceae sp. FL1651]|nr:hypothetical protein F5Y19DRAFT_408066 [Xylariaceae sp. FL1651]